MLSTLRRSSLYVAKRKTLVRAAASSAPRRTLVQPSGADRASVVDVPSTYQDDNLFSPRPGGSIQTRLSGAQLTQKPVSDMLGFKLEGPRREGTLKGKTRPIYLDMQVRYSLTEMRPFLTHSRSGDDTCRSPSARRDAPLYDGPIRKPTQSDSRLRLGGRQSC